MTIRTQSSIVHFLLLDKIILAYVCEAPIIQGYDENNEGIPAPPIYPNGPDIPDVPSDSSQSSGIGGEVVGILFGVIVGLCFVAYAMYYVGRKKGVSLGVTAGTINAIGSTIGTVENLEFIQDRILICVSNFQFL